MKTLPKFLSLLAVLMFAAGSSTLHAQYNPPPPPDQTDQGQDQGAPPPDQQAPPDQQQPMDQDQGAPGPDDDQGAPPPDDGSAPPDASGSADFQTFYNDLSSQGTWVQTDNYGYAWQPGVQDPDWAPYRDGHWVYTDEGWTWVADASEPWGWATYHYGRWVNLDGEGWVWVPGYTWAPAWVSWRYGGGYCGWAPLPPDTFVGIDFGGVGFGFHIGGDCDTAYGIGPGYYNFIPVGYIGARDYRRHYENRYNNFAIINNTRNVTSINVSNRRGSGRFGRVTAGGPSFATVNAQSHTPVQRVTLARSSRAGNSSLSGNRLAVFAPHVTAAPAGHTFQPQHVGGHFNNVQINRGASISQPLAVNSRLRPAGPSTQQIQAANTAQAHVSSAAQVATAGTQPKQALTQPLTSFHPHNAHTPAAAGNPAAGVNTHVQTQAATGTAERAFTGQERVNRPVQNTVNQGVHNNVQQNHVNSSAIQPAANVNANAAAERARVEQAHAQQVQNENAQRVQNERTTEQHTAPQHTQGEQHQHVQQQQQQRPQQVQHSAPVQHAAPQQRAAPQQHGGGNGGNGDHSGNGNNGH